MLLPKYQEAFQDFPADLIYYQVWSRALALPTFVLIPNKLGEKATAGRPDMREAMADFLTEHVNKGSYRYNADKLVIHVRFLQTITG